MAVNRILILGGYGNFGKRIVEALSALDGITLIIAGRDGSKSEDLRRQLASNGTGALLEAAIVDIQSPTFFADLKSLQPDLVIHTGGPFQSQDYGVPCACIDIGAHYIDLADDRRFVCDIPALHERAHSRGVLLVSGASSVPGLSSTVVDGFKAEFQVIESIEFAIAPGNKAERGMATVRGILSYTGRPFPVFIHGRWTSRYGWMSPRKSDFGKVIGKRWLANVDIPDLELFPARYEPVKTVRFQAGLELSVLHWGMVFMALLARVRLINNWAAFAKPVFRTSELFRNFGTDIGGMKISLGGLDHAGRPLNIDWLLCAENGVGPYIPTLSATILAKKLIEGHLGVRGAMPCLGLYTLDEFDREAAPLGIYHHTERSHG